MLFQQQPRRNQKIQHISNESFRVYKKIYENTTIKTGKNYKYHFVTRAYTEDGQFYERISFNYPSHAELETSVTKWGSAKGRAVGNISDIIEKLQSEGWTVLDPEKIQEKQLYSKWTRRKKDQQVEKPLWTPADKDFKLAIAREEKRTEFFKKNEEIIEKIIPSFSAVNEEHARAIEFQDRMRKEWEERTKRKKRK